MVTRQSNSGGLLPTVMRLERRHPYHGNRSPIVLQESLGIFLFENHPRMRQQLVCSRSVRWSKIRQLMQAAESR